MRIRGIACDRGGCGEVITTSADDEPKDIHRVVIDGKKSVLCETCFRAHTAFMAGEAFVRPSGAAA